MKTEVRIRFDGKDVPGGEQTVLEPARCGADVANVEYVEVLRQIVVWVTLEAADERLAILLDLLRKHGVDWSEHRADQYTDEELDRARLVFMDTRSSSDIFGGPRLGTKYSMKDACPACGAGARQTSALMVDGKYLRELKGRRAASTFYSDILVDAGLAEDLGAIGAIGLSFRDVYALMKTKKQIKLPWQQMCAARTLPPMSPRSTGVPHYKPCKLCKRSCFTIKQKEPPRLVYRAKDVVDIDDVNTTWEWYGHVDFDGDVSNAIFPYPWFLVTPKVMHVIRAAGNVPFRWLAVRIEDE